MLLNSSSFCRSSRAVRDAEMSPLPPPPPPPFTAFSTSTASSSLRPVSEMKLLDKSHVLVFFQRLSCVSHKKQPDVYCDEERDSVQCQCFEHLPVHKSAFQQNIKGKQTNSFQPSLLLITNGLLRGYEKTMSYQDAVNLF